MTKKTIEFIQQFRPQPTRVPINKCELEEVVDSLIELMFPICDTPRSRNVTEELIETAKKLHINIARFSDETTADIKTEKFFEKFSSLQERLFEDAECYLRFDPAAKSLEEVIITYPGFYALCVHRIRSEEHTSELQSRPHLV